MMTDLVEGYAVLIWGEPYILDIRSNPPGFWIVSDVRGKTHLVRESEIEDAGLNAHVAWVHATHNSK
jgi:hypothetical protein